MLSNDPMTNIKWPSKIDAAGRQALENARAAGHRFFAAKYDLRNKVLSAYDDYALTAEQIRLERSNLQLLETIASVSEARNRAGASHQQDVLRATNDVDLSRNSLATMQSQLASQRASLDAMLAQIGMIPLPDALPAFRPLIYSDSQLLDLAAKQNPELIALADEVRARQDSIQIAKLQYIPDFNLSIGTDLAGMAQSLLAQATVPMFRYEAINAAVAQGEANLHAAEAAFHQTRYDLKAQVISDILTLRDSDRQIDLFEKTILPRTKQMVDLSRSAYETGGGTLLDVLNSQQSLIAIQRLVADLRVAREKRLLDLETVTGNLL